MKQYRLIDHTADLGISVQARTLKKLFIASAESLFDLMLEGRAGRASERITVKLDAPDMASLLNRWLSELLYLFNAKKIVPVKYFIRELTENTLAAEIDTGRFNPGTRNIRREIKAVTYHDLKLEKKKNFWNARILFDI